MSPPWSGQLPVGDSVCCVAMFHLITTAWAFSTVFSRPEHSLALICGCTCFFDFFFVFRVSVEIFMQPLLGYLCEKHKLAIIVAKGKTSVSCSWVRKHCFSKNGLLSRKWSYKQKMPPNPFLRRELHKLILWCMLIIGKNEGMDYGKIIKFVYITGNVVLT